MDYEIVPDDSEADLSPRRVYTWPLGVAGGLGLAAVVVALLSAGQPWRPMLLVAGAILCGGVVAVLGWRMLTVQVQRAGQAVDFIRKRIGK